MLHVCVERFDVMGGRGNILGWEWEVNKAFTELNKGRMGGNGDAAPAAEL
jgi:hypothetical protein